MRMNDSKGDKYCFVCKQLIEKGDSLISEKLKKQTLYFCEGCHFNNHFILSYEMEEREDGSYEVYAFLQPFDKLAMESLPLFSVVISDKNKAITLKNHLNNIIKNYRDSSGVLIPIYNKNYGNPLR